MTELLFAIGLGLAFIGGMLLGRRQGRLEAEKNTASAVSEAQHPLQIELTSLRERLKAMNESKQAFGETFENLANRIFQEKAQLLASQNKEGLNQILAPLKKDIDDFKKRVETVYDTEGKQRSALQAQVQQLMSLNQTISQEAKNLTSALKGSVKVQGNFGEMILTRLLETAGLREGHEYETQASHTTEEGRRLQPDVVIKLPEGRALVIDSKVSLNAYEAYTCAETPESQKLALDKHLQSVRNHMRGLSEKSYQSLLKEHSLDCVLMFVAVEPAFMTAVTQDVELFNDGWKKNVLLVSPSTLLFVLRTVSHLWRQEEQNKNAQKIAQEAASLYDKVVGFVEDMEKVGSRLQQAQQEHESALRKLTGRGGITSRVEKFRQMGVATQKQLPSSMLSDTQQDDALNDLR
jgi:DNA recombination protein RmuC